MKHLPFKVAKENTKLKTTVGFSFGKSQRDRWRIYLHPHPKALNRLVTFIG